MPYNKVMRVKDGEVYISNDKVYIGKDAEPYHESTLTRYHKKKMKKAILNLKNIINERDK